MVSLDKVIVILDGKCKQSSDPMLLTEYKRSDEDESALFLRETHADWSKDVKKVNK